VRWKYYIQLPKNQGGPKILIRHLGSNFLFRKILLNQPPTWFRHVSIYGNYDIIRSTMAFLPLTSIANPTSRLFKFHACKMTLISWRWVHHSFKWIQAYPLRFTPACLQDIILGLRSITNRCEGRRSQMPVAFFVIAHSVAPCVSQLRCNSSVNAILCQLDGPQTFSSLPKSHGPIKVTDFTLCSHILCALEFHVVYNGHYIINWCSNGPYRGQKIWCPFFFFEPPAATNQPGSGPAFWFRNPLAKNYENTVVFIL